MACVAVGGRDLPEEFTFKTFCDWIRHELEEELERRWYIEANGVGVPETYGPVAAAVARGRSEKPSATALSCTRLKSAVLVRLVL